MVHCVRVIHTQGYGKAKAVRISKSEDLPACRELPSVTEYDERYGNGRQSRPVCFCIFDAPVAIPKGAFI